MQKFVLLTLCASTTTRKWMKKPNMTKIKQIEYFQTRRFSLLMPIGDSHHHHTLYIMYASRFKSPKNGHLQIGLDEPRIQLILADVVSLCGSRERVVKTHSQTNFVFVVQRIFLPEELARPSQQGVKNWPGICTSRWATSYSVGESGRSRW